MPADLGGPGAANRFFLDAGHDLNFFQAVHLLEGLFANRGRPGTGDELASEPIRFETLNSLAFPASDVAAILPPLSLRRQAERMEASREDGTADASGTREASRGTAAADLPPLSEMPKSGKPLRMALTFMGLYGVSSPLPSYFVDPITLRKIEYFELKKFLDIFNHRLYSLFYRAWKKYRHFAQFLPPSGAGGADAYTLRLLALTGQWPGKLPDFRNGGSEDGEADLRRIPYARFLSHRVRSARGLQQLLRGYFGFARVRVRQFTSAWEDIPVKTRLGEGAAALGVSTRIGERMEDRLSRFTVDIGPLPRSVFDRFFSSAPSATPPLLKQVRKIIDAYLRDPLEYRIRVILESGAEGAPPLGSEHARIGRGIWLGAAPAGEIACVL